MATDLASRSRTELDRHDLRRQDAWPTRRRARTFPFTSTVCAILRQMAVLLERFGKHDHLDAAGCILEHEHAHPVALACLQRTQAGDDAANRNVLAAAIAGHFRWRPHCACGTAFGCARRARNPAPLSSKSSSFFFDIQIRRRLRAVFAQVVRVAIDRMPAPVETERFLLVIELLDLRPGRARRGSCAWPGAPPGHRRRRTDRVLSQILVALRALAPCSHAASMDANRRARVSRNGRSGRASDRLPFRRPANRTPGLDERLEHALVRAGADRAISHSACSDGMLPPQLRARPRMELIAPSPSPLMAVSPKRTPLPRSTEKFSWPR